MLNVKWSDSVSDAARRFTSATWRAGRGSANQDDRVLYRYMRRFKPTLGDDELDELAWKLPDSELLKEAETMTEGFLEFGYDDDEGPHSPAVGGGRCPWCGQRHCDGSFYLFGELFVDRAMDDRPALCRRLDAVVPHLNALSLLVQVSRCPDHPCWAALFSEVTQ